MVSILEMINEGLHQATGLYCYAEFPHDGFELPLLIVTENYNQLSNIALDGRVEVAELTYTITIYSEKLEDVYMYQELIDSYFNDTIKRFSGTIQQIQQSYPIYHRTLTYRGRVQKIENNYYIL